MFGDPSIRFLGPRVERMRFQFYDPGPRIVGLQVICALVLTDIAKLFFAMIVQFLFPSTVSKSSLNSTS